MYTSLLVRYKDLFIFPKKVFLLYENEEKRKIFSHYSNVNITWFQNVDFIQSIHKNI